MVLSGGVTPGLADDFPQQVLAAVAPRTGKLVVDTSKAALAHLLASPRQPVHVLRLDQREAEQAAGHPLASVADSLAFAQELIARGVAQIVVGGAVPKARFWPPGSSGFSAVRPMSRCRARSGQGMPLPAR
ncbi:hypothetical protein [Leisingera aquaemixtae]|uniref:hypothetical protein n=1 Tax=Leisingera aquaemixtae TaxID=1396826 RepID=UPI0021A330A1|nr:hypothetical protein [Leisingera aquaemixtae]